jgi:UDP-N-acetylmuramoyl-L-alanyl-D-glutamate--2,6-diaminopimelate ligase
MEPVTVEGINIPYTIIIDYAHTPDALEKAMQSVKQAGKGRLIAVYGSCGDRDKTKRPILGAIGGRIADIVIITDEEAYTESPRAIIDEVAIGVQRGAAKDNPKVLDSNFFKIYDRKVAIAKAMSLAKSGDCILVTGMGDQSYKVVGSEHIPWSDRDVIRELIRTQSQ